MHVYLLHESYDPGEGPFPAVLDLCTFMSEKRGCLLANKGFVVLAVAVYTDKPDNVKQMHLDHFKEAVDFLQQQPKVILMHLMMLQQFFRSVKAQIEENGFSHHTAQQVHERLTVIRQDII